MGKYFVSFWLFLLMGCATFSEKNQLSLFDTTSRAYEKALLLGKYETANSFTKIHTSEEQSVDFESLKKIRVTSYELIKVKVSADKSLVNQTVEIQYYQLNYFIEKTIVDNQIWKYYPDENLWYLESGLPDFTMK